MIKFQVQDKIHKQQLLNTYARLSLKEDKKFWKVNV